MNFRSDTPIYLQIANWCFTCIASGQWAPDERIPSVRELAVALSVNTHTVLKALEYMQKHDIIIPRRGLGFFLASDARERVSNARKEQFFENTLPDMFSEMKMLGISIDEVIDAYNKIK
jgi:hypothetical protein